MATCPTCGHQIGHDARTLLDLLKNGSPHREVYKAWDGGWYVTYGGGPIAEHVVRDLIKRGEIVSVYDNCPDDAYHVGKTLNMDATMAGRKAKGKNAPFVFTDGSTAPWRR